MKKRHAKKRLYFHSGLGRQVRWTSNDIRRYNRRKALDRASWFEAQGAYQMARNARVNARWYKLLPRAERIRQNRKAKRAVRVIRKMLRNYV